MTKKLPVLFIIINIVSASAFSQHFTNNTYEPKCIITWKDLEFNVNYYVDVEKVEIKSSDEPIMINNQNYYKFAFGQNSENEYINLHDDTLYLYLLSDRKDSVISQNTLFVLSIDAFNDSIFIECFGDIKWHYSKLESVKYYSNIKDSVFTYKLHYADIRPYPRVEWRRSIKHFNRISISKNYGIIEFSYFYEGYYVEYRFF